MFGLQLETHRQDEALLVLLAVTDQEHPTETNPGVNGEQPNNTICNPLE